MPSVTLTSRSVAWPFTDCASSRRLRESRGCRVRAARRRSLADRASTGTGEEATPIMYIEVACDPVGVDVKLDRAYGASTDQRSGEASR